MSDRNIAILTRARDMVKNGWLQNKGYDQLTGKMCAGHAVCQATKLELEGVLPQGWIASCDVQAEAEAASMLLLLAAEELTLHHWESIPQWNDAPWRTLDEVVDTFDRALKMAGKED